MGIVEKQTIRFRPDRKIQGRAVDLGIEGDNMVRRLLFVLPEMDGVQTATLMYGGKYADMIQLTQEDGKWSVDLTAEMVGAAGEVEGYIRMDGAEGEKWHSDAFRIETGDLPDIEVQIEKLYPTAVDQMLGAIAEHKTAMAESLDLQDSLVAESEANAERAEEAEQQAETAAQSAQTQAGLAAESASEAQSQAAAAQASEIMAGEQRAASEAAAIQANDSAQNAAASATSAEASKTEAGKQAAAASQSAADAKAHAESVGEAAAKAESEANRAQAAANALENPSAAAETLEAGVQATAQWTTAEDGTPVLKIGVPRGEQGEKGDPFVYADFTQEQLAALVGPQGETGPKGPAGDDAPQIDDAQVTETNPWSSRNIVDRLCPAFEASGSLVQCHPVEGDSLGVVSYIEPVQAGEGDPSPENVRAISGHESVALTHGNAEQEIVYTAQFGQTVYGGEYDWETGVLTVDRKIVEFDGTEIWGTQNTPYGHRARTVEITDYKPPIAASDVIGSVCTHYIEVSSNATYTNKETGISFEITGNQISVYDPDHTTSDISLWTSFLAAQYAAGTPLRICYPLKEPIEIQLTQQEILPLPGTNSLYTDAGETAVSGRADPKHIITSMEERLAALEAAIVSST